VSGIPAAAGAFSFTIAVSDATSASTTRSCGLSVTPALIISDRALPEGSVGVTYNAALDTSGGTPPYTWALTAGSLAPGLFLDPTSGRIAGAPSAAGTFRATIRVTDAAGIAVERDVAIVVTAGISITACPDPVAEQGRLYTSGLSVFGGAPPFVWSIAAGTLPAGISLEGSSGILSGMPRTIETANFTLAVSEAGGRSATRACSVAVAAPALSIETASLPAAVIGAAYVFELRAAGGVAPYGWRIVEGAVPAGMDLTSQGLLQGAPEAEGEYSFTVQVTDGQNTVSARSFSLTVAPAMAPSFAGIDLPEIVAPAQQPTVRIRIAEPYPHDVTGTLRLTFTADPGLGVDDPAIGFSTGGREAEFTIPAGQTEAVFRAPRLLLQTGTVAGRLELHAEGQSGSIRIGPAMLHAMRVDRLAPRMTSVRLAATDSGFEVRITGYSTIREVTSATFRLTPADGVVLRSTEFTVPLTEAARRWYQSVESHAYGSQFTLVQPFSIANARANIASVTVTISNAQGGSEPVTGRFE
jgi:hypothetical protein